MNPKPTIAITGATGLIGRALCMHLVSRGYPIRALARHDDAALAATPGIQVHRIDLPDTLSPDSLRGCDIVIHAAYPTMLRDLKQIKHINETGTRRLLQTSRDAGVARFIFVSTTSAHDSAASYYGQSKLRLEGALDPARDLVIRPGLVLASDGGLFNRIRVMVRKGGVIPLFGGGKQVIQTIHIQDLCAGFAAAIEQGTTGRIVLAEPRGLLFKEFLQLVAKGEGRKVTLIPLPIGPALLVFRIAERFKLGLPVGSENLLGLKSMRFVESQDDIAKLGITVRSAAESLKALA